MTCKVVAPLLALHAGGDLPPAVAAGVDRHLARCAACQARAAAFRGDRDLFAAVRAERDTAPAPDLGPGFWQGIHRAIHEERGRAEEREPPVAVPVTSGAFAHGLKLAAAAVLVALGAALWWRGPLRRQAPEGAPGPAELAGGPRGAVGAAPRATPVVLAGGGWGGERFFAAEGRLPGLAEGALESYQVPRAGAAEYPLEEWRPPEANGAMSF